MTTYQRIYHYLQQFIPFYSTAMSVQHPSIRVYPDKQQLGKIAVTQLISQLNEYADNNTNHIVNIATSGGSLPATLSSALPSIAKSTHSDQIHIWFADERCVPLNDKESNYYVNQQLISALGVQSHNIHKINESLIDSPSDAANDYNTQIQQLYNNNGQMDILLLGMGPDGHCCSLFPNHSINLINDRYIASITDSPKPPSNRITFTHKLIATARSIIFIITGSDKADSVRDVLENTSQSKLPTAQVIRDVSSDTSIIFYLDVAAASKLSKTTTGL